MHTTNIKSFKKLHKNSEHFIANKNKNLDKLNFAKDLLKHKYLLQIMDNLYLLYTYFIL